MRAWPIRRETFDRVGGFDERFILCGSDVAIGLDTTQLGLRNVCSPFGGVRHLESATRGSAIPTEDFFASYWRYNPWLFGNGDPYFSPNLSLSSRKPKLRGLQEPTPASRLAGPLGRDFQVFRQRSDAAESTMLADTCRVSDIDVAAIANLHAANAAKLDVKTINWFIPDIDSPFYGGINTALRLADYLHRNHGVQNRFVVWGSGPDFFVRSAITAAFPSLADSEISFFDGPDSASLELVPPADASIATLWLTAYAVARAQNTKRKFYLVQDFEPMFYPASTSYALAEETYRLGLYALCNTENLRQIYADEYGGKGMSFMPAIDPSVFHAHDRPFRSDDAPTTVFVYARPGHWRNCWELASLALRELKERLGDGVRVVTAGSWATDPDAADAIKQLGLLPYKATGELYRHCDVGLALTVSKHPSYLPLELMACGVPVVAFDNSWGHWILKDGENSLLARRTVPGLVDAMERMVVDPELRRRLASQRRRRHCCSPRQLGRCVSRHLRLPVRSRESLTPVEVVRRRVAVVTTEPLSAELAGPAIRAVELGRVLATEHDVEVASTASCSGPGPDGNWQFVDADSLRALAARCDVMVLGGDVLAANTWLADAGPAIVVDLYDPFHLEQLEQARDLGEAERRRVVFGTIDVLNAQAVLGDTFLVCVGSPARHVARSPRRLRTHQPASPTTPTQPFARCCAWCRSVSPLRHQLRASTR